MAIYKRGGSYWYEFTFAGKRIRESAKSPNRTIAREAERARRRELELTLTGMPLERREDRIRSVSDVVRQYLNGYELNHRTNSVLFAKRRLAHVVRVLGPLLLPDVSENALREYMRTRLKEGVKGRTINMELGELSRAIGKSWSNLWPRLRRMEESKNIGRCLSPEEEGKLLSAAEAQSSPNGSQTIGAFLRIALLTGMRSGEISGLTWGQIDFGRAVVTVGRAKTASGTGRQIPLNEDLVAVLERHRAWFVERFGETRPNYYLFPFGKPMPSDPTRPIRDITTAWDALRKRAGVSCRFHDLRHTAATKLAESGHSESTMLALMGHMSRAMMERYSHIRMSAKREAVKALTLAEPKRNSERVPTKVPTKGLEVVLQ